MRRRDYHAFIADVRRLRPFIVIVISIIVLLPSFSEMVTQELSPMAVLLRLVEAAVVVGLLVWSVSAVVLNYARIQAGSEMGGDEESEIHA